MDLAKTLGEDDVIAIPSERDCDGHRVMIFKPGRWRVEAYGVEELLRGTLACLELGVLEPKTQILGGVCIFDLEGLKLEHATKVTPHVARKVFDMMVTSFPLRVHAVHVVRAPWPFRLAWRAFKPLLRGEPSKRVFLHGSELGQLHDHIGRDCLPRSLGGPQADISYKRWLIAMHEDKYALQEMRSLGYHLHPKQLDKFVKDCSQSSLLITPPASNKDTAAVAV